MPKEIQEALKEIPRPQIEVIDGATSKPTSIDNYDEFMNFLMTASLVGQVYKIRKYFEDRKSQGRIIGFDVPVALTLIEVVLPVLCQSISLINTGPNPVKVWLNNIGHTPRTVRVNIPLNVNFETHELEKIYLQCDAGTALAEIVVKY